jgi:hypothetical protein
MTLSLTNVLETPPTDGWSDEPLPLVVELPPAQPFPMDALPPVMADYGHVIQRCTQAPDALVGSSLLAAASLAVQPYANVQLPHGAIVPVSLYVVSVAESGERKSAVDRLALHPHAIFEKAKSDEQREAADERKRLPKAEMDKTEVPREAVFLASDPTVEGLCKLLYSGLPSLGVFSAEGGRFLGGYGMSDDAALRTAAGLSLFWDGAPVDRVRAGDGASKLYGRRVALHLMAQPRAAFQWLRNPILKDQGMFSRCLIAYPQSTAGTRLFREERADQTPAAASYVARMTQLLAGTWPINEFHELQPQTMRIVGSARDMWINEHDQIEQAIAKELHAVRGLASKAAEHMARIAAVLTLMGDPAATMVTEDAMRRAAVLMEFYLGEALRLSDVQPQHEQAELTLTLWTWLSQRGKRYITLPEMAQFGPAKLRKAQTLRMLMEVLAEHYLVRRVPDGMVEYAGKPRREAWEVRL